MSIAPQPRSRLYTTPQLYLKIMQQVFASRFTDGDDVGKFETAVSKFIGVPYALAMPMARTGIFYAVKALIRPGQKVVMSPYTIADVVNMVICAGGIPVFADLERDTCNLSAAEVERLIDADTGAVLATHFYGLACDIEKIAEICRARKIPLIEDSAQAFGTMVGGRRTGSFGDIGVFSFGMYKNVNSFYGGMVLSSNRDLIERIRTMSGGSQFESLKHYLSKVASGIVTDILTFPPVFKIFSFWFFRWAYLHRIDAINRRLVIDVDPKMHTVLPEGYARQLTPMQARIALPQLALVENGNQARIAAARRYYEGLKDIDELILPPMRTDGSHIYTYYCMQYRDREALVRFMQKECRDVAESYHRNCAELPCFAAYARDCPNARFTAASLIYLPTYPRYPVSEIDRNIEAIRRFFNKAP